MPSQPHTTIKLRILLEQRHTPIQMIPSSSNRRSVGQGVSANPNLSAVPEDNEANESLIQTDTIDAAAPVRGHP